MLDLETLMMLFDELSEEEGAVTFDDWSDDVGYSESWTDEQIYSALPDYIKALVSDIVMNSSWWHDGM